MRLTLGCILLAALTSACSRTLDTATAEGLIVRVVHDPDFKIVLTSMSRDRDSTEFIAAGEQNGVVYKFRFHFFDGEWKWEATTWADGLTHSPEATAAKFRANVHFARAQHWLFIRRDAYRQSVRAIVAVLDHLPVTPDPRNPLIDFWQEPITWTYDPAVKSGTISSAGPDKISNTPDDVICRAMFSISTDARTGKKTSKYVCAWTGPEGLPMVLVDAIGRSAGTTVVRVID